MKILLKTLVIFLFVSINISAIEPEIESWYVKLGYGFSISQYHDDLDKIEKDMDMDKNLSKNFNLLSFYYTVDRNLLAGLVLLSGGIDSYEKGNATMDISRFHLAASATYFLESINKGFFARGDFGLSKFVLNFKAPGVDSTGGTNWGDGIAVLLGGGYALPVTKGSSVMFEVNFTYKTATDSDDAKLTSTAINIDFSYIW